jgi:hypothetical protein
MFFFPKTFVVDCWCVFMLHQFTLDKKLSVLPEALCAHRVSLLSMDIFVLIEKLF